MAENLKDDANPMNDLEAKVLNLLQEENKTRSNFLLGSKSCTEEMSIARHVIQYRKGIHFAKESRILHWLGVSATKMSQPRRRAQRLKSDVSVNYDEDFPDLIGNSASPLQKTVPLDNRNQEVENGEDACHIPSSEYSDVPTIQESENGGQSLESSNAPANEKKNVNGKGTDGQTSNAACFYRSDVTCSISTEYKSEQVGVAKGENEETEGGMAPKAKGGKCPSNSSGQNSKVDNPQSAPYSLKEMTA